ncbi:thiol:disulfide interchange protein DsbA/DsbL [Hydrogenophaga sp. OTU3427]|uniref:thiol:disulfide interchange protein DsbA/DsbL n=1 Tax=Hydrogenophaga sp. OTU3427 TaxID=3043856 RepID=UPI00313CA828
MQRRDFTQAVLMAGTATTGLLGTAQTQAQTAFKEGTDYLKLSRPAPVDAPADKVEVIEFFWYSCPHCNAFEPTFDAWAKKQPAHVVVKRAPVAFRDDFVPQQRLYYALEALGKVEELHRKVFHAIHTEKQRLTTQEQIADWIAKQGVDRAKFLEVYNAFGVAGKARRASQLQDAYQVDGVPSLGIAGKYFTSGSLAQNMPRTLQVAEHLIAQSRSAK